jgi:hypothetical protein
LLIFATNLDPAELVEEAFLRRIHYKIPVTDPTRAEYALIFQRLCQAQGIGFTPEALAQIDRDWYKGMKIHPRACHPRDILSHVADIAKYQGTPPMLSTDLVDRACRSYFLSKISDE